MGEAAHAAAVVRPKDEVPIVATISVGSKARTWADEVFLAFFPPTMKHILIFTYQLLSFFRL